MFLNVIFKNRFSVSIEVSLVAAANQEYIQYIKENSNGEYSRIEMSDVFFYSISRYANSDNVVK